MPAKLPDCDEVFTTFFDRWYDDASRQRKQFPHTRPDIMDAFHPGNEASALSPLSAASQQQVLDQISAMLESVSSDWPSFLPVTGEIDTDWVQAMDAHYNADRIATLIEESDAEDFANPLVVTICQFGAVLGQVMTQWEPRLQWLPEWPYWESSLYDPATGQVIPPFHWAIKKFSDYGVDDGYVPKIGCMTEILNKNPDE
jgi:hypothetical protein